jgi:psp operon transcriptional activator
MTARRQVYGGSAAAGSVGSGEALGQSDAFLAFQERLSKAAPVERPVLLVGERGTGKELAAARLHYLSRRWDGPLVALNCAALSPSLIEAELFGHEKGAFTGAAQSRAGRFEAADGGTLFLDELGAIPMEAQEKILRVVEYGTFEPVGSAVCKEVNVRIVGATNADLPGLAASGRFKQDLLDRLSFEVLFLPPLRERAGDVMLLARHFGARMAYELGLNEVPVFSEEATRRLQGHTWPGNIRELKNVVERAVYRTGSSRITEIVFDPFIAPYPAPAAPPDVVDVPDASPAGDDGEDLLNLPLKEAEDQLKIRLARRALLEAGYNQRRAAEILGITYDQFRGLYRKYRPRLVEGRGTRK